MGTLQRQLDQERAINKSLEARLKAAAEQLAELQGAESQASRDAAAASAEQEAAATARRHWKAMQSEWTFVAEQVPWSRGRVHSSAPTNVHVAIHTHTRAHTQQKTQQAVAEALAAKQAEIEQLKTAHAAALAGAEEVRSHDMQPWGCKWPPK